MSQSLLVGYYGVCDLQRISICVCPADLRLKPAILSSNWCSTAQLLDPETMSPPTSEKPGSVQNIEDVGQRALDNIDYDEEYSYEEQRKIIHRIDRRLVTMTGLAYCISLMDRTNLSMAAVAGYGP